MVIIGTLSTWWGTWLKSLSLCSCANPKGIFSWGNCLAAFTLCPWASPLLICLHRISGSSPFSIFITSHCSCLYCWLSPSIASTCWKCPKTTVTVKSLASSWSIRSFCLLAVTCDILSLFEAGIMRCKRTWSPGWCSLWFPQWGMLRNYCTGQRRWMTHQLLATPW